MVLGQREQERGMWVKLDDGMGESDKLLLVSPLAAHLHVQGIIWSSRNLTDGFLPRRKVLTLISVSEYISAETGKPIEVLDLIRELCATPAIEGKKPLFLERADGSGYDINDYLEYNPSREEVLAMRATMAERGARGGKARAETGLRNGAGRYVGNENEAGCPPDGPTEDAVDHETPPAGSPGREPDGAPDGAPDGNPARKPAPLPATRYPCPEDPESRDRGKMAPRRSPAATPRHRATPPPERLGPDAEKPLLVFPVAGGDRSWTLTLGLVRHLQQSFPDLDVMAEARLMLTKIETNGMTMKTAGGMPRTLTNWLANVQNGRFRPAKPTGKSRPAGPAREAEEELDELEKEAASGSAS